ncbi:hypothetical protein EDEG_01843 [Edhazardia aedis USNM 41457]|uniref:Uncharacterized protein n=1 Tax=Edhazardia aedis (strain USNM 41457) TaxID=1003232 RepID=J9D8J6_EDHAE|nr:hypothetical protein EDEG_01843 [Edhazardia aedis USNM 41457]|eukprot:EJW03844.1 hypothetical protein EDEG_01843 [Edhazardia aedis USNM 41457]
MSQFQFKESSSESDLQKGIRRTKNECNSNMDLNVDFFPTQEYAFNSQISNRAIENKLSNIKEEHIVSISNQNMPGDYENVGLDLENTKQNSKIKPVKSKKKKTKKLKGSDVSENTQKPKNKKII